MSRISMTILFFSFLGCGSHNKNETPAVENTGRPDYSVDKDSEVTLAGIPFLDKVVYPFDINPRTLPFRKIESKSNLKPGVHYFQEGKKPSYIKPSTKPYCEVVYTGIASSSKEFVFDSISPAMEQKNPTDFRLHFGRRKKTGFESRFSVDECVFEKGISKITGRDIGRILGDNFELKH